MMMVDTEIRQSPIHGLGVFLKEPVKAGTLLWRFDPRVDRVYAEDEINALPPHMQEYLRIYSTWHEQTGPLCAVRRQWTLREPFGDAELGLVGLLLRRRSCGRTISRRGRR